MIRIIWVSLLRLNYQTVNSTPAARAEKLQQKSPSLRLLYSLSQPFLALNSCQACERKKNHAADSLKTIYQFLSGFPWMNWYRSCLGHPIRRQKLWWCRCQILSSDHLDLPTHLNQFFSDPKLILGPAHLGERKSEIENARGSEWGRWVKEWVAKDWGMRKKSKGRMKRMHENR